MTDGWLDWPGASLTRTGRTTGQALGGASYAYNAGYGAHTPPPGFPRGLGDRVVLFRKSVAGCTNYSDDGPAPTSCQ